MTASAYRTEVLQARGSKEGGGRTVRECDPARILCRCTKLLLGLPTQMTDIYRADRASGAKI